MTSWRSLAPETLAADGIAAAPDVPDGTDADNRFDLAVHRREVRRARARRLGTGAAGLVVLLLLWQAAAAILHDAVILPSVTQTARSFAHYLTRPIPRRASRSPTTC